ncbi:MAG: diphosphomevalonate decarboxylase [Deltaproteobacteria bacterium]|nr:diphosphomevalonate decarboxylase [Deltaproteobacteria bacterium]
MSTAEASANIALIKYWGKRDARLNLPETGSLSLTLAALRTRTDVTRIDAPSDRFTLDGTCVEGRALERVGRFVDLVRDMAGRSDRVEVTSSNRFPTAAGLASSASAFAALAVASLDAFGVEMSPSEISRLARRGSGSAARSVFGGFCRMHAGVEPDGRDAFAVPFEGAALELVAAVVVAKASKKTTGSTDGMNLTQKTSPYHAAWVTAVSRDLLAAEDALRAGDLMTLADVVEGNCLAMHADAMAARPGILYFKPSTLWAIEAVRGMRKEGTPVFFTIDAGPHVVAFTLPAYLDAVVEQLAGHPEVECVLRSTSGEGAHLVG